MQHSITETVQRVIARHLDLDPVEIRSDQHLRDDLGLLPLDLALIAVDLEDIERIELPIERLDSIGTVQELTDLVHLIRDANRQAEERARAARRRHFQLRERHAPWRRYGKPAAA